MLPTINGKSLLDCSLEDIKGILDDQDYRESEYIDYKKSFEITEIPKSNTDALNKAKAEFRKDVCAFANARGGYLIYGIKEAGNAVPHDAAGFLIANDNTDTFENTVKNALQTISPRIPHYEIRFIPNETNYIVIIYIHHDFYAPYIYLENNQDYRVYKRVGNSIKVMTYVEMKTMFTQSFNLEKEIEAFRAERIQHYLYQEGDQVQQDGRFFLLHIIPDTFLDAGYNRSLFVIQQKGTRFSPMFYHFECCSRPFPIPEGLRFLGQGVKAECRLYNNGIAEYYYSLSNTSFCYEHNQAYWLDYSGLWFKTSESVQAYVSNLCKFYDFRRVFICISIKGCKNVSTEENAFLGERSKIDRENLLCSPIALEINESKKINEEELSLLHLGFLTSLGVRFDPTIKKIIEKIY